MTTTNDELPPCPFKHTVTQGSRATDYEPYATDEFHEDGKWNIICPVCFARSGFYDTAQEAIEAWSRRAAARTEQAAREVLEAATKLVCGYCDGHFPMWQRKAERGAAGSGNWIHHELNSSRVALCVATGIHNKLEFDRDLKGASEDA